MKKSINESGRNRRKFTILDLFICLIVIAGAAYIGIRFFVLDRAEENSGVKYEVTFMISEEYKDAFHVGDDVLTPNGEKIIGKITAVEFEDATETRYNYTVVEGKSFDEINYSNLKGTHVLPLSNIVPLVEENSSISETSDGESSIESSDDSSEVSDEDASDVFNEDEPSDESEEFVYEKPIDGYIIVKVTVEGDLEFLSENYYIDGEIIKIDSEIELTTKKYSVMGKCTAIEKSESEQ